VTTDKILDSAEKKRLMTRLNEETPYWSLLGMELVDIARGRAKVRLPFSDKLRQTLNIAHGGSIFSAADSSMGLALWGLLEADKTFVTAEMKINFIRQFSAGNIIAEGTIIHSGSISAVGEATVTNDAGALIAKAMATFIVTDVMPRQTEPVMRPVGTSKGVEYEQD